MLNHALLLNSANNAGGESLLAPGNHYVEGSVSGQRWLYTGFSLSLGIGGLTPRRGFTELYVLLTHESRARAPELTLYCCVYCTRDFYWNGQLFTNGQKDFYSSSSPVTNLFDTMMEGQSLIVTLT